jgi:hypothetical protein
MASEREKEREGEGERRRGKGKGVEGRGEEEKGRSQVPLLGTLFGKWAPSTLKRSIGRPSVEFISGIIVPSLRVHL